VFARLFECAHLACAARAFLMFQDLDVASSLTRFLRTSKEIHFLNVLKVRLLIKSPLSWLLSSHFLPCTPARLNSDVFLIWKPRDGGYSIPLREESVQNEIQRTPGCTSPEKAEPSNVGLTNRRTHRRTCVEIFVHIIINDRDRLTTLHTGVPSFVCVVDGEPVCITAFASIYDSRIMDTDRSRRCWMPGPFCLSTNVRVTIAGKSKVGPVGGITWCAASEVGHAIRIYGIHHL